MGNASLPHHQRHPPPPVSVTLTTSWTSLTTEIQETEEPCDAFGFSHKQTELFLIRIYCCKKCWANNSAESSCLSTGRDSHKFLVKSQNGLPNLFLWNFLRRGGESKGKQPTTQQLLPQWGTSSLLFWFTPITRRLDHPQRAAHFPTDSHRLLFRVRRSTGVTAYEWEWLCLLIISLAQA